VNAPSVTTSQVAARPWCKWVGGKTQLLPELRKHVPANWTSLDERGVHTPGRYFEPFVGGGALFFDLAAKGRFAGISDGATLSDNNELLVMTYRAIRDHVYSLILTLREHEKQYLSTDDQLKRLDYYLSVRAAMGTPGNYGDPVQEAARFIVTNKTGYNGLFRVNASGKYNVPHGRYTNPKISDDENLVACSRALHGVDIRHQDFVETMSLAREGDFMYCDPPYVPVSATSDFTSYTAGKFGMEDQTRLRDMAWLLKQRGVHVLLSNADVPMVRELYKDFEIHAVQAKRNINRDASKRGKVGEVLIK
jgi:DNA adenine methylase